MKHREHRGHMTRAGRIQRATSALAASIVVVALLASGLASNALAVNPADKAQVVLDLDFSGSILGDPATRNQFATALEAIANSVDEQTRELIKGDTLVSIVQFASKAQDVPRCSDIKLLGSPLGVRLLADCLRTVAGQYRSGGSTALTQAIGRDTNYVEAMNAAAKHLPAGATRPTMILFTDGKHDVKGVPVSQVQPTRERLFGQRKPFALLPVGMGLKAAERPTLEAGLKGLQTINAMPPCSNGDTMAWPEVVFATPDLAGTAVAQALQAATCTFTAAPVPSATAKNVVSDIRLTAGDGSAQVRWDPPTTTLKDPIVSYRIRCTADGGGDPIETTQEPTPDNSTVVQGLANGTAYACEVAADTAKKQGDWVKADTTVTPAPVPAAPSKPTVTAGNRLIDINAKAGTGQAADSLHYECSPVGASAQASPATADVQVSSGTKTQIGGLKNGTAYVCRATAINGSGMSAASAASDAVTPCDGVLECNNLTLPVIGGLGALIALAVLVGVVFLARNRTGSYVVAVVDTVHSANLGGGSELGLALVGGPYARQLEGIAAAKGRKADVKIHKLRGDRFRVTDKRGSQEVHSGEPVVVESRNGVRHELVLRAFEGRAASEVTVRR